MNREVINWLLEGPDWLKYAVELQLLDLKPDLQVALRDISIVRVVDRLKSNEVGIPALGTGKVHYTDTGKAYWDLFFLADIGLTAEDLKLSTEIERVFNLQSPDGTFLTGREVMPNYFCMSAILISSAAKMGYRSDPRLQKYIQAILNSQGLDGGWHCYNSDLEMLDIDSCPMDNLNILMLLGQYEEYRTDPRFNGGIDLLLEHWNERNQRRQLYGFGIGRRFSSLSYPAVKYGVLRVLDVLSLFPYAVGKRGFQSMLDFVCQKSSDGKYFAESIHTAYADFDFGQMEEPSRWLTFLVNRIEKRVS
ncbi:hypothetical protein ACFLXU_00270 [Chloroflexota bacterium]